MQVPGYSSSDPDSLLDAFRRGMGVRKAHESRHNLLCCTCCITDYSTRDKTAASTHAGLQMHGLLLGHIVGPIAVDLLVRLGLAARQVHAAQVAVLAAFLCQLRRRLARFRLRLPRFRPGRWLRRRLGRGAAHEAPQRLRWAPLPPSVLLACKFEHFICIKRLRVGCRPGRTATHQTLSVCVARLSRRQSGAAFMLH